MREHRDTARRTVPDLARTFLRFAFLSGIGWLCDFGTYTLLLTVADAPAYLANFISSYVGVTFVYLTSLRFVFNKATDRRGLFLVLYWGFQFVSILAYSAMLQPLVNWLATGVVGATIGEHAGVAGKIIITPFNLITNFLFMKFLTNFMKDADKRYA